MHFTIYCLFKITRLLCIKQVFSFYSLCSILTLSLPNSVNYHNIRQICCNYTPPHINTFGWTDRNVPRQCTPVQSGYCSNLPYNLTTYPNMLDHTSIDEVDMVIDQIKQVVDSGCYPLAYELLCQVVQPVCYNDRIVKPCVVFCQVR